MFNLNSFVPSSSDLYLLEADFINDHDDITGSALLPNGDVHQYLLLRCDDEGIEDCHGGSSTLSASLAKH